MFSTLWSVLGCLWPPRSQQISAEIKESEEPTLIGQVLGGPTLMELLEENPVDWDAVESRLLVCPHEASVPRILSGQSPLCAAIDRDAPPSVIRSLLAANPDAAREVHWHNKLTALYLAVARGANPEVVSLILRENPAAARQPVFNGCLPLHASTDVETARVLIESFPEGIGWTNEQGYLPLHRVAYAGDSNADVVQLLIEEGRMQNVGGNDGGGGVFVETAQGITPLEAVCCTITGCLEADEFRFISNPSLLSRSAKRKWAKLEVIVKAASRAKASKRQWDRSGETHVEDKFRILHSVINLGTPELIVWHALQTNREQCTEYDELGRSALSVAASKKETPTHIINMLLDPKNGGHSAAAGKIDIYGRLPLHYAIESGRCYDDAIKAMINAAPGSLEKRDGQTHLYPFMMAAVGNQSNVNLVYILLKETPWLVQPFTGQSRTRGQPISTSTTIWSLKGVPTWLLLPLLAVALQFLLQKLYHLGV